jgi:hypothetical protein
MSESTTPGQCTDAEWEAARDAGLLFEAQGTNAFDAAIHKFAEAMRAEGYAAAIEFIATGSAQ